MSKPHGHISEKYVKKIREYFQKKKLNYDIKPNSNKPK